MQFHFDPNQKFQLGAIAAIADLFDGQPDVSALPLAVDAESGITAISNQLALDMTRCYRTCRPCSSAMG